MEPFNLSKRCRRTKSDENATTQKPRKDRRYKGTEHIPKTIYSAWKRRARRDKIPWSLTINDIEQLWLANHGHCAVTGRALTTTTNDPDKMSLDRVDSSGPYADGNVRLVTVMVNYARHEYADEDLMAILNDMRHIKALQKAKAGSNWFKKLKKQEFRKIFGRAP